jgi:nitroreductase
MPDTIELLLKRRSTVAANLKDPGPDDEQLKTLLRIAARVHYHGKLAPWRFIIFQGGARADFGRMLAQVTKRNTPEITDERVELEATRFMRAPVIIAVISSSEIHPKIPQWEQVLSAGAVCQNLLVAASAMGYAAQWITEWYAYDEGVRAPLKLAEDEKVAGFIYIGSSDEIPEDRRRPNLDELITYWSD